MDKSHRTQQEEIHQARKHKAKRLTASEKKEETKRDKLQQYEKIKQLEEEFPFEILNKGE